MKDGEHYHNQGDPEGKHNHRKLAGIILLAVILAFVAYGVAQTALDTASINNIFSIVVNNTDLYPSQRTVNTLYYANESPIAVYIIFHAVGNGAAQTFDSNFSINSSVVLDKDFKTSASAGFHDHWSMYTIVPKGSNYSITNSTNVFTIEWREYPILSGRNGTLSVNQTFVTNGSSFNSTYDQTTRSFNNNYSAQTFPNSTIVTNNNTLSSTKLNKTITAYDIVDGNLNVTGGVKTPYVNMTYCNPTGCFNLTAPSSVSDNVAMYLNGTDGVTLRIETIDSTTSSFASFQTVAESNRIQFTSHSNARTSSRFGVTVGGWSEIVNTNGASANTNGLIIGTTANKPLLFGTNSLGRMNISADGNITVLTAGKGIILKSPDGTKCGFLNWTDANTFATTATTCP